MKKYYALHDISIYKSGQEIPKGIAETWIGMFKVSPVREVEDTPKVEIAIPQPEKIIIEDKKVKRK